MITKYKTFENSSIPQIGDWVVYQENIIGKLLWVGIYWSNSPENYAVILEEEIVNQVPEWVQKSISESEIPRIEVHSKYVKTWDSIKFETIIFHSKSIETVRVFVESQKYNL